MTTTPPTPASSPIAPPTFVAVISSAAWESMFDDPELELALRRIVHGDQRFTYRRPLRAGDRVQATLTIDKVRNRGAADIISSSVEVGDAGRRAGLHRRGHLLPLPRGGRVSAVDPSQIDGRYPAAAADRPVHPRDLVRYAGASTDFNPIHYSERFAAQVGLPGVVGPRHADHGQPRCGWSPTGSATRPAVRSYSARFTKPVVVPDDADGAEVIFTATVAAVDGALVTIAIEARLRRGEGARRGPGGGRLCDARDRVSTLTAG